MRERDQLLGPPSPAGSGGGPRTGTKLLIGVLLVAVVTLGLAVAFLLGRNVTAPADPQSLTLRMAAIPARVAKSPPERAVAEPRPGKPALALAPVTQADWKKLGVGCVCAFSRSQRSKELFIAGGDDLAIWRPAGDRKVCPLKEEQLQELFDDDAKIQCGSSRIVIRGYGKTTPGFDGHSRQAKLTVYEGGREITLSGHWGCGC
jgi:hypothetical protein